MKILTIKEQRYIDPIVKLVRAAIDKALPGGPVEIRVLRESKKRIQEEKYHSMIGDISKTVEVEGKKYDSETWKAWLIDAYEQEVISNGEKLRHPGRVILSLDKQRAITIRASSTDFLKSEASGFIEFLNMIGAEYGARFTEKSLSIYENERG